LNVVRSSRSEGGINGIIDVDGLVEGKILGGKLVDCNAGNILFAGSMALVVADAFPAAGCHIVDRDLAGGNVVALLGRAAATS
jgi:hypothetical protein